jgi:hypothetical protein
MLVRFNTNDISESQYQFFVTGSSTGVAPLPEIGVALAGNDVPAGTSIDYGTALTGVTVSKQYTVTNTGDAMLNLSGWTFVNPAPSTQTSGSLTQNGNTSTLFSTSGLSVGSVVSHSSLPVGTTITAINGSVVTFSAPATGTSSSTLFTFLPVGTNMVNPFSFNGTLPSSIAVGASATFTVNYFSNVVGSHSWNVRVNTNDLTENPFQFNVAGSVALNPAAPDIAVFNGTTELAHNATVVGSPGFRGITVNKTLIIKNLGSSNLTLSYATTALLPQPLPTTNAIFVVASPSSIAPGATGTLTIGFNPSALSTSYSTRLTITSNDPDESPMSLVINSTSMPDDSEIGVSYAGADLPIFGTLPFGDTTLGSTVARTYTVTNTGTATLMINSMVLAPATGTLPAGTIAPFYVSSNPGSLNAGATGTVTVVYRPVLASTADAWVLTMNNSDADEFAYKINLTGSATVSATPAEINVTIDGADIASGSSLAMTTAVSVPVVKDVVITNTGTGPLIIGSGSVSNTSGTAFSSTQVINNNTVIPAGGTATWKVRFWPTAAGSAFTGKLTLYNTDSDESAYIINLTGSTVP